jgi:hypothetical protein
LGAEIFPATIRKRRVISQAGVDYAVQCDPVQPGAKWLNSHFESDAFNRLCHLSIFYQ